MVPSGTQSHGAGARPRYWAYAYISQAVDEWEGVSSWTNVPSNPCLSRGFFRPLPRRAHTCRRDTGRTGSQERVVARKLRGALRTSTAARAPSRSGTRQAAGKRAKLPPPCSGADLSIHVGSAHILSLCQCQGRGQRPCGGRPSPIMLSQLWGDAGLSPGRH